MTPENRARLEALGRDLAPAMLGGTNQMFAALNKGLDPATKVTRDHAYGPHARNRLDLFTRDGLSGAPVLVLSTAAGS